MTHKWNNNICLKCGLKRELRPKERIIHTSESFVAGNWQEVEVYRSYPEFWYGDVHKFKRPECKMSNYMYKKLNRGAGIKVA